MEKTELIDELNQNLCFFIKNKFFTPFKINGQTASMNKYAKACGLSSSTISKINDAEGYSIPVSTIYLITKLEKTNLKAFFTEFSTYLNSKNLK